MKHEPHSEHTFGDSRELWWNSDFIALMGDRWRLAEAKKVLDVGSGQGHWSRALAPVLAGDAELVGVEPEAAWRKIARERSAAAGLEERVRFIDGSAEALPFDDATFDVVTCQTVLMHVADVQAALSEMLRVLEPGGLLAVAEPNNRVQSLILNSVDEERSIDDIVESVRCDLIRSRGKRLTGEGDDSVGDRLPRLFHENGLTSISVHLSDHGWPVQPPYEHPLEKLFLEELSEQTTQGRHFWTKPQVARWFEEGGGASEAFEAWWGGLLARSESILDAAHDGRYYAPGGMVFYLVAGRKPPEG